MSENHPVYSDLLSAEERMDHIRGAAREQITLFPEAIEDYITPDNPVRFLDAYVDGLDTIALGFQHAQVKDTGREPYDPKDLLKLYLYGYLNRIRSSRLLERETQRNLEVLWLLKRLSPDHKTISDFRRNNATALRDTFKRFVLTCKELDLFAGELVAIDSTKFTASNARDRVKDAGQLQATIERLNASITGYLAQLDQNDGAEEGQDPAVLDKDQLQEKIQALRQQQATLQAARTELQETGQKHISLTDPDARLMKLHRSIEPAYSLQTAVDSKHSLIVDYELTQDAADNNHLASVATAAKAVLAADTLTVCADAGYYDTLDLKACEEHQITAYVSVPAPKISKKTNVPSPEYFHDRFVYDPTADTYRCPQGHLLHRFDAQRKSEGRLIYRYRTNACGRCAAHAACTTSARGRYINRWEHEAVLERLEQRLAMHPEIIKRRKALIEHTYGTIKRVWGYGTLLLRTLKKVPSEIALMSLSYNIRRVLNIVGTQRLVAHLQQG